MQFDFFRCVAGFKSNASDRGYGGYLYYGWMTGRIARPNTAAVFIFLRFWSWLWRVWDMHTTYFRYCYRMSNGLARTATGNRIGTAERVKSPKHVDLIEFQKNGSIT